VDTRRVFRSKSDFADGSFQSGEWVFNAEARRYGDYAEFCRVFEEDEFKGNG
jgi:hypothetical protein